MPSAAVVPQGNTSLSAELIVCLSFRTGYNLPVTRNRPWRTHILLKNNGANGHLSVAFNLNKSHRCFRFVYYIAVGFWPSFIKLRKCPSVPVFPRCLIRSGTGYYKLTFSHLLRWLFGFYFSIYRNNIVVRCLFISPESQM